MSGVRKGRGRKGLVNNSTLMRIHGCILAVSVDEGKHECLVGVSHEKILCEWTCGFTFNDKLVSIRGFTNY